MILSLIFPLLVLGGLGYAASVGLGHGGDYARREGLDAGDVVKSIAISFGLFLAMLAVTAGLIYLLQAIVGGDRLAGSNSDLARGLSLLIVGTPVFAVLARLIDKKRGGLGWSVHLVAALTILLIGVLVSTGMIIDDLVEPRRSIERPEVAQLFGWLVMWLGYWFSFRTRFRVFGHVHLAIGTVIGLAWLVAGTIGVGATVLSRAYDGVFGETLIESGRVLEWILVGLVGLAVWLWHWLPFNSSTGPAPARKSSSWYAAVVGFAIVPASIALVGLVTASIAGTLTWFIGTTDKPAAEWFEAAPAVFTVAVVALAVWAYHRWELIRDGEPTRNEAARFHDYALAAVGLVGAVSGLAGVLATAFQSISGVGDFAGSLDLDNQLIITLTLVAVAAALWWTMWQRIEAHRLAEPVNESSSVWRKLYLAAGAGVGGLTLAGAAVFVLFAVLQDLFDGELGRGTIDDLAAPLSWILAVAAAVWFHANVWRQDRAVLAAHALVSPPSQPGPPSPPAPVRQPAPPSVAAAIHLRWATAADFGEIFTLQRAAFVDEAVAYGTPDVPSLNETYDQFVGRMSTVPTVAATAGTRIVGAVSVRVTDGFPWLERLMVAPDRRGDRIGHRLIDAIIGHVSTEHAVLRAVVGDRNPKLLDFYESQGFITVDRTVAQPDIPELLIKERVLTPAS